MVTLKTALRMNASTCLGFGLLFVIMPASVAGFLSQHQSADKLLLMVLGAGLMAQGCHLIWASMQTAPSKALILYFSFGDFAWVLASIFLMILGYWITTPLGMLYSSLVAAMVGALGLLQMQAFKNEYCQHLSQP